MNTKLTAATVAEATVLVGALAGYLVLIARDLRHVSQTLGRVAFGVRAIETQTAPVGPLLREVDDNLEQAVRRRGGA
jgi:hypothetical protein